MKQSSGESILGGDLEVRGNLGGENLARRPVWQPGIFSEYFGMVGEREIDAESR